MGKHKYRHLSLQPHCTADRYTQPRRRTEHVDAIQVEIADADVGAIGAEAEEARALRRAEAAERHALERESLHAYRCNRYNRCDRCNALERESLHAHGRGVCSGGDGSTRAARVAAASSSCYVGGVVSLLRCFLLNN